MGTTQGPWAPGHLAEGQVLQVVVAAAVGAVAAVVEVAMCRCAAGGWITPRLSGSLPSLACTPLCQGEFQALKLKDLERS